MNSRCFSRSFSSLSLFNQQLSRSQSRTFIRINHDSVKVAGRCLSRVVCKKQPLMQDPMYIAAFRQIRGLQTTSVFCGDVITVKTPQFADSVTEGDIRWDKAVGDSVAEDEVIGEIETDKTSLPVPAPGAGVIVEFLVEDGTTVQANTDLLKLELGGDAPAAAAPKAEAAAPAPAAP